MRLRVQNALLHKLGFVQPPYFYTPCVGLTTTEAVQTGSMKFHHNKRHIRFSLPYVFFCEN